MSLTCSVYGLGLQVNVPIAGLKGLPTPPHIDVSLALGSMPRQLAELPPDALQDIYVSDEVDERGTPSIRASRVRASGHFRLTYADGTQAVISAAGDQVWATGPVSASVEDTATYLLGPVLGFVLRLRGVMCLHASAVAIDGRAVAIAGAAGAGKSSTAAAFARLGYPVLTDDVATLVDLGDSFRIQPAYPRVRLWPDTVAGLFGSPDALPRITPTWDKRYLDLREGFLFQREPLPLAAVYVLAARSALDGHRLERMSSKAALMSLVSETYGTRLLDRSLRAREFELLGRLVEHVPVKRLTPCSDLARIPELCEVILSDVRETRSH